ncbi:1,4-alpha-glucan branching enzyme [Clostridium sp. SY8519]|nr:1,4-alpha-glucan branching enzyme [Clostridium sp. SY8519]
MVERWSPKPNVEGSSPSAPVIFAETDPLNVHGIASVQGIVVISFQVRGAQKDETQTIDWKLFKAGTDYYHGIRRINTGGSRTFVSSVCDSIRQKRGLFQRIVYIHVRVLCHGPDCA